MSTLVRLQSNCSSVHTSVPLVLHAMRWCGGGGSSGDGRDFKYGGEWVSRQMLLSAEQIVDQGRSSPGRISGKAPERCRNCLGSSLGLIPMADTVQRCLPLGDAYTHWAQCQQGDSEF